MRWWIKLITALAVLALLAWLALGVGSSLLAVLKGADLGAGERDPMFAEEAETVTRPPEIYPEETQKPHKTLDDYVPEEEAPVDKTIDELIREAQASA